MSLNYMLIHQLSDFQTIIDSPVLITGYALLQDEETATNMWYLSFDELMMESLLQEHFETFIHTLINKRKHQIAELYNSAPATFYMWFDEMANQLRFNIISGHTTQLPFSCTVEIVNSIEAIWQSLKNSSDNVEMDWDELEFFEDDSEDDEEEYILKVYVEHI